MRQTKNEKLIERQTSIARYTTFASLAILFGSLVISFQNYNILLAYGTLLVGFMLAYIGSTLGNQWVKEPRADVAIAKALKGFDNKHHLYDYLLPAAHVLLTPTGLIVFLVKNFDGTIAYKNGKWERAWAWTRMIGGLGQGGLGDPMREMQNEIAKMKNLLTEKIENGGTIPVDGYVLFTDPRVQLTIDDQSAPIVLVEDLKETLRKTKRGAPMSNKMLDDCERALNEYADAKATK
jgi:hypothetical protein